MLMAAPPEQRWSEGQKRAIVEEAFAPGASASEGARRVVIVPEQIYRWRREFGSAAAGFGVLRRGFEIGARSRSISAPVQSQWARAYLQWWRPQLSPEQYSSRCMRLWRPQSDR